MLPEKQTNTNIGVGIGIVLKIAGRLLQTSDNDALFIPGLIVIVVGVIVFAWGCMNYVEGKGHNKWLGLVGLLSIIGLIILVCFPDHHKDHRPT